MRWRQTELHALQAVSPNTLGQRGPLPQLTVHDELPEITPESVPEEEGDIPEKDDPIHLQHLQAEMDHTNQAANTGELLCVLAVIRHGDRTPKHKLKLTVRAPFRLAHPLHCSHVHIRARSHRQRARSGQDREESATLPSAPSAQKQHF
jgi:hypothetical protein